MKRFFSMAALAFVTSTVMIPAVNAQVATDSTTRNNPYTQQLDQQITPFDLVEGAYQGLLQEQGIPTYDTLISEYVEGKVTPEKIVRAAIQAEDTITTASSIKNAPYSRVFQTGSIYAVRDHDFRGSEPTLGVSTLWSKNPTKHRQTPSNTSQVLLACKYFCF